MYTADNHSYFDFHLRLLQLIEPNPTWTDRHLARALGAGLSKANHFVRDLKDKGLVKWDNFIESPNKLAHPYILTPQEVTHKLQLDVYFLRHTDVKHNLLQAEFPSGRGLGIHDSYAQVKAKRMDEVLSPFRKMVSMLQRIGLSALAKSWRCAPPHQAIRWNASGWSRPELKIRRLECLLV